MSSRSLKSILKDLTLLFGIASSLGCGEFRVSNNIVNNIAQRVSLDFVGPLEPGYCVGPSVFVSPVTITGNASYQYRPTIDEPAFKGLGAVAETPNPIRYAEYVVLNTFGQVIQCGETDNFGAFSFTVPNNGQVYRLQVRSRADNNFVKASVLRSPESNQIYYAERAFSADSNQNINLVAPATGSVLGGAFHILDQIYIYNERLRNLVGTCPAVPIGCVPFTVAPKVSVYWERGFNPGTYIQGSPVTSFYFKGLSRLFLLGGENGDVDFSDTDHFDNSIIAHEYFHFLEDIYSQSDSPGGPHNGNQLIDPRLAWSEGLAQFFQAVMTNITRVIDTIGNIEGASQFIVNYSVENTTNDIPTRPGEGEFREFSVARLLWDMYDDTPTETNSDVLCTSGIPAEFDQVHDKCARNGFPQLWAVLTGGGGFNDNNNRFISSGLFHQLHRTIAVGFEQNLNPLRVYEQQTINRSRYGRRLAACGSSTNFTMSAPFSANNSGTILNSDPLSNNRYYYFGHGGGPLAVRMNTSTLNGLVTQADLRLYPEIYTTSGTAPIAANLNNSATKDLVIPDLAAGVYMLIVNVRGFNSAAGSLNHSFQVGPSLGSLGGLCASP